MPLRNAAEVEARHVTAIANAMLAAQDYDALLTARPAALVRQGIGRPQAL